MAIEVGNILEGKIVNIMPFGAFVALPEDKTGLVHISEVSSQYVEDINTCIKQGDIVKVKVTKIDDSGKISLSIKKAEEKKRERRKEEKSAPSGPVRPADIYRRRKDDGLSFEDKLKQFMQEIENKMSDLRAHTENRRGRGRR